MFRFVKRLRPYLVDYKKQIIFFLVVIVTSLVIDIIKIFWTVDLMDFNINTPTIKIASVICGIAVFTILISILGFAGQMTLDFITINVFKKVREDIYNHINKLKVDFAKSGVEGDFLTRWASDLQTTQSVFMSNITSLIISPISTVIYTVYLTMKRGDLFLISFLPVFLALFTTNKYGKYLNKKNKEMIPEQAKLNDIMTDSTVCIQIVKIYMLLKRLGDKFSKINLKMSKIQENITKVSAFNSIIQNLMWFDMGSVMCYAYGGYLCYTHKMDVASLFVFKFIFSALTNSVNNLPVIVSDFRVNTLYINRVFDIFDYETEKMEYDKLSDISYENHIEFTNVSFAYDKQVILGDCSFKIKKGERVAIVGENCKTTILNLICGFYTPNNGSISVCGYYINERNIKYIRNKISIVEQEPTVFLGSIKENVICGYKYSPQRFEDATNLSLVSNFVKKFFNEYNTYLNGQSAILSGGQSQRLNLARALYKDSEILLLDNYTSALDNDTKRKIYKNMKTIKDRTIIVFSNNLYDLEQVDRVILIKDGQVYKDGKHEDLMECEYYKTILNKNDKQG